MVGWMLHQDDSEVPSVTQAYLGIMLLCCWKGPGMGLPVTLNTGLGLWLPEARWARSSFT